MPRQSRAIPLTCVHDDRCDLLVVIETGLDDLGAAVEDVPGVVLLSKGFVVIGY